MTAARDIIDLALSRPPTLGTGRLIAVDGPSGSGKTTLATAIAAAAPPHLSVSAIHLDDLYAGWSGLATIGDALGTLLRPLARGRPGEAARWDWTADRPGDTVTVEPVDLLVLEGVGAGHRQITELITVLAWCTPGPLTPEELLTRALDRDLALHPEAAADPAAYRAKLEKWQADEAAHFAVDATGERADIALG